jgi:SOS response regulatory protein OraA/RecX
MLKKSELSQEEKAYEKALKFLEIRAHTTTELRRKLGLRGFDEDVINLGIQRLLKAELINDSEFALNYLENLIKYKTFGYFMLLKKLLARGVDRGEVEKLLREHLSLDVEKKLAEKYLETKNQPDRQKAGASLQSRGFRTEVIREVLSL